MPNSIRTVDYPRTSIALCLNLVVVDRMEPHRAAWTSGTTFGKRTDKIEIDLLNVCRVFYERRRFRGKQKSDGDHKSRPCAGEDFHVAMLFLYNRDWIMTCSHSSAVWHEYAHARDLVEEKNFMTSLWHNFVNWQPALEERSTGHSDSDTAINQMSISKSIRLNKHHVFRDQ